MDFENLINNAFSHREHPKNCFLSQTIKDSTCNHDVSAFFSKLQNEIDIDLIKNSSDTWEYFDQNFVFYYLPTIIKIFVKHPNFSFLLRDYIIWDLNQLVVQDFNGRVEERWSTLREVEALAIVEWLKIEFERTDDDVEMSLIITAIEGVKRKLASEM